MRPLKSFRASLRYRISLVVAAMMAIAWTSAEAQRKSSPRLPFADTTGESDVYPIGDAVDVYRAVLDLFYIDGKEKAPIIVLVDTAQRAMGGPCTWRCTEKWRHKSRIDTATIIAYSRQSMKRPRIVGFRYPIRTVAVSVSEFERMTQEGFGLLSTRPADKVGPQEAFWAGFSKRFPGAWGYLMLGKVGFNPRHTEALIAAYQNCGPSCNSFETIFLKRLGREWTVVERVPEWADSFQSGSSLRYRGPLAFARGESQVLATSVSGKPARSPSDDAGKVYAAVVEKLYNFYGQRPGRVVVTESRTYLATDRSAFHSRIDSSTFTDLRLQSQVRGNLHPHFTASLPLEWVSDTALKLIARDGATLAKTATDNLEDEQSPLWYGFHARYPDAWGYLSFGVVGLNPRHTQAVVFSQHFCGAQCVNGDGWFLERKNELWYVVERVSLDAQPYWYIEGLRYLGTDARSDWYRPRRVRASFVDAESGKPLTDLALQIVPSNNRSFFVQTDRKGEYSLENPRQGGFAIKVKCPEKSSAESIVVGVIPVRAGLDTTVNIRVDFSECPPR